MPTFPQTGVGGISWGGTVTSPQDLANIIQGEAGSNPAGQFAVASTMYNRLQAGAAGGFANTISGVVTPTQFNGYNSNPNSYATTLANDLFSGNAPSGGNPGNALYFSAASSPYYAQGTATQITAGGANIGGNLFSDQFGAPSSNFVAPQYGAASVSSSQNPGTVTNSGNIADMGTTGNFSNITAYDNPSSSSPYGSLSPQFTTEDNSVIDVTNNSTQPNLAATNYLPGNGVMNDSNNPYGGLQPQGGYDFFSSPGYLDGATGDPNTFNTANIAPNANSSPAGSPAASADGSTGSQGSPGSTSVSPDASGIDTASTSPNVITGSWEAKGTKAVTTAADTVSSAVNGLANVFSNQGTTWLGSILSNVGDWFVRGGIFVLGFLFIAGAIIWLIMQEHGKTIIETAAEAG